MTENRKKILDLLIHEDLPMSVSQIHEQIAKKLDLATVYRSLGYLEENGYVSSFVYDCQKRGVERYFTEKKTEHEHFMHCESCHKFIAIHQCPLKSSFSEIEEHYGFIIDEHFLTLRGTCKQCT